MKQTHTKLIDHIQKSNISKICWRRLKWKPLVQSLTKFAILKLKFTMNLNWLTFKSINKSWKIHYHFCKVKARKIWKGFVSIFNKIWWDRIQSSTRVMKLPTTPLDIVWRYKILKTLKILNFLLHKKWRVNNQLAAAQHTKMNSIRNKKLFVII